jgi:hypothetical protein
MENGKPTAYPLGMSSTDVRVHNVEQAIEMAKASFGQPFDGLGITVETEQDFWIVRFGPDTDGETHSYLVSIWDETAGRLTDEITINADLGAGLR